MYSINECWDHLEAVDVVNQVILLDELLRVNEDVIITVYSLDDEILYSIKNRNIRSGEDDEIGIMYVHIYHLTAN